MIVSPIGEGGILVVYGRHQARAYPEFPPENVIPYLSFYLLGPRVPKRVFRTSLGRSGQAMKVREALEGLAWDHGTEIHHVREIDDARIDAEYMRGGPCFICGDPVDHYGAAHGVATGDGRTRADIESEASRT